MRKDIFAVLGLELPILSAPIGGAAGPELVAAVCNAGGYGVIPLWGIPAEQVVSGIKHVQARTQRDFAVSLNLSFPHDEQLQACIDTGVHAVSLFWGTKPSVIARAKKGGLTVLVSVGDVEEARIAEDAGADVIVAQGWEAGGHVWGQVATMALVPAVADAVDIPVVAAGGIADGRGLAAALMLGASAAWIGTRFLASSEAAIHDLYRHRILNATETSAEWYADLYDVDWPRAPHRALKNSTSVTWKKAGRPSPGDRPGEREVIGHKPNGDDILRYQSYTPLTGTTGNVEAMSLWAGQGVSLARKVMPAAEILAEIYQDAKRVMQDRCSRL